PELFAAAARADGTRPQAFDHVYHLAGSESDLASTFILSMPPTSSMAFAIAGGTRCFHSSFLPAMMSERMFVPLYSFLLANSGVLTARDGSCDRARWPTKSLPE